MKRFSEADLKRGLTEALGAQPAPVGLGARAFSRLGPGLFLPGYRILCCRHTKDLETLRGVAPVECLEELAPSPGAPCRDTLSLLSHPLLERAGLVPHQGSRLLVYQENQGLRELADARGWRLLANPFRMRRRWEDKAWFRVRLKEAGFRVPQSTLASLNDLNRARCRAWLRQWGRPLVIQIPDFPRGGGRATFVLNHEDEVEGLCRVWGDGHYLGHPFEQVLVCPWIDGPSLSMEGCVIPGGTLISPLQTQLLDIPEVLSAGGRGRFCGHQWGGPGYPQDVEESARELVRWVGEALRTEGFRGLFGVDFALDRGDGRLYGLECNPRYTGAFPTLTLLQQGVGLPPLEGFHVWTWLGGKVSLPVKGLNESYREMPPSSHLFLYHRGEDHVQVSGDLEAARYRWDEDLGMGLRVGEPLPLPPPPWDPMEFLLLDGPPPKGSWLLPGTELDLVLRAVFFRPVIVDEGKLEPFAASVIGWAYRALGLDSG